jgi:tRNA (cytidine32/uridine32-2'-O)-methyltransferase
MPFFIWGKMNNIRIVLVGTTHPGNIGATARAMKSMELDKLYLVAPKNFPHVDATARAAGADDLLATAKVTKTLDEAIADCNLIVGTSARLRALPLRLVSPQQGAEIIKTQSANTEVAILFGRENNGLTNEELLRCHYHINIPTNSDFTSLNLASAVQIIAYELYTVINSQISQNSLVHKQSAVDELATAKDIALFYQQLQQTLIGINFLNSHNSHQLMQRLHRLFNRAMLEKKEINILRGILSKVLSSLRTNSIL